MDHVALKTIADCLNASAVSQGAFTTIRCNRRCLRNKDFTDPPFLVQLWNMDGHLFAVTTLAATRGDAPSKAFSEPH